MHTAVATKIKRFLSKIKFLLVNFLIVKQVSYTPYLCCNSTDFLTIFLTLIKYKQKRHLPFDDDDCSGANDLMLKKLIVAVFVVVVVGSLLWH